MKHYHFLTHIYKYIFAMLLAPIASFYLTTMIGIGSTLVSAIVSFELFLGFLIYSYLHWGYDLSARERCGLREFWIGLLPAQGIHFIFCLAMYAAFLFLKEKRILEILPLQSFLVNMPPMGFAFALNNTGTRILTILLTFVVMTLVVTFVLYACYRRGVFLKERERKEMLLGIQRVKKGPIAARFWFIPLVNITPIFSYLYRHFFLVEYRIRDAIIPVALIALAKIVLEYLVSFVIYYVQTLWMYFLAHFFGLWLWGVFISLLVLSKEKEREKRER